ncbi:hypothetical protein HELRODRAFT_140303, partial [Helobdella robusta]|uniref:ATP-dependent RNA helicase n=1 Tax=Helobdella robusta TaxID=6412 RepID=T1EJ05_HELRO
KFDPREANKFRDFPLTEKTQKGCLELCKYKVPTVIQSKSLIPSLKGEDILGAAKTGSGKTLAFIIPILEKLFKLKWSSIDGVGALVLTPTRELAYQIFEVLRKVGKYHDFSAGLVIGGKEMNKESEFINNTNIIISTPGRLLHHMDQTPGFSVDNLQILVLDEADRMLDMGFQQDLNCILQNLPAHKQTLLYSATQTRSVKDLARLNMTNWVLLSDFELANHSTPDQLTQRYVVCDIAEKLNFLWSFIRTHPSKKILVFLSTCKQVRFVFELFSRVDPELPVLCLHGSMPQMKRLSVYQTFISKSSVVLLSTDLASRGLDFPSVDWVVQCDCPEDVSTYIHRVGRTARYEKDGRALLMLLPSEENEMVKQLKDNKVPIEKINANPNKLTRITRNAESLCASDVTLKQFAQRAFVSYLKSVGMNKNKDIFSVKLIDYESFAGSLGLSKTPRVRFIDK